MAEFTKFYHSFQEPKSINFSLSILQYEQIIDLEPIESIFCYGPYLSR
jgi:hypothetical protein